MTEADAIWAAIERRAVSSVTGVRLDDDDALSRVAMTEAPMNPHKGAQAPGGMGGPGMMPPMMMGGMGGRGGGESRGGGGASGNTLTGGGEGAAGGGGAASAGMASKSVTPGPESRPAEKTGESIGGGGGVGGGGAVGAGGGDLGAVPDGGGAPEGSIGGGSGDGGGAPVDGYISDREEVKRAAARWAELRDELGAVDKSVAEALFGLVTQPERPQQAVNEQVSQWLDQAVQEMTTMEERLRDSAQGYDDVDNQAIADIRREVSQ